MAVYAVYMVVYDCIWIYMIENGCRSAALEGTRGPSRVYFRYNVEHGCNPSPLEGTRGPSRVFFRFNDLYIHLFVMF